MAEYNHHHHLILIAFVFPLLLSNYTTTVLGRRIHPMNSTDQKEKLLLFLSNYTRALGGGHQEEKLLGLEERQDQKARRSLALAALDPDPTSFLHLLRIYYENTYFIHPETKKLVRVYVNPRIEAYTRCRRCYRPAAITEANWRRYEDAVKRPPRLWITRLDVSKCRVWLEQNPNPL